MKQLLRIKVLILLAAFTISACTDDNVVENREQGDPGAVVNFNVSSAQEQMLAQQQDNPFTRVAVEKFLVDQNLTLEDLVARKLEVQGSLDACLIETTIEGVNPMLPIPDTRANVKSSIDDKFTSLGYRSDVTGFTPDKPEWFYKASTNANGTLVTPLQWAWTLPYGRFYAIYPEVKSENKLTLSPANHTGTPYVEFEVDQNVKNQKDLMTACSGEVKYEIRGTAPETNLKFRHALTAVRFAVGQNLSWNKTIDRVEIRQAMSKGKYILPTELNNTGNWVDESLSTPAIFTLSGLSISTNHNPNTMIMGNNGDNYTFYMIPQTLTGKGIQAYIHFSDGTDLIITLKGEWKPGTTKTYKLSQNTSTWEYHLTTTNPTNANYDDANTTPYTITSFRKDPVTNTQQPVAWRIAAYQESVNNGASWSAESQNKPDWLTGLTIENGNGGTAAESGTATLKTEYTDQFSSYNNVLKNATPKGSADNYYNLANQTNGGATIENTANSYLISAPGYYQIPLVYGNAIKGGHDNPSSYRTSNTGTFILGHFKDHANQNILSPYINVQHTANRAKKASIIWADKKGIVEDLTVDFDEHGDGSKSFVKFKVPKNKIRNANAVIAVKNDDGTIMWSWHLWFDQVDALSTITCTNFQGKQYKFTKRNLGYVEIKEGTSYTLPRKARLKIEQTVGHTSGKQYSYIIITQNNSNEEIHSNTIYQFGRKDALPGVNTVAEGSFVQQGLEVSIQKGIQHPETFYRWDAYWQSVPAGGGFTYYNTWSTENTVPEFNDNTIIKTIYDPCPVGFHLPPSNAFTGFTSNGQNDGTLNTVGAWNNGWTFNNKLTSPDKTIFFPALVWRSYDQGSLRSQGTYYCTASPYSAYYVCTFFLNSAVGYPVNYSFRSNGSSARPVADE